MVPKLAIWCNAGLSPEALSELQAGVQGHRLLLAADQTGNLSAGNADPILAMADVAFGQPDPTQVAEVESVRWIQLTSAGYTRYDVPSLAAALRNRGATLTNSSSVFDEPCAQHLLAFMLSAARQLPQAQTAQVRGPHWAYEELRGKARLLKGQTVLLVGYGAIACRLVELMAPFDLNVLGVRRRIRGDEAVPVYRMEDLDRLLPTADLVVNILPASPETSRVFDAGRFALMKEGASFFNIGRGTTVDQDALLASLQAGAISVAYLDVTDPEPLPSEHPIWKAPNCFITPHIGGGMPEESTHLVRHFLANLRRFEKGEALRDVVF